MRTAMITLVSTVLAAALGLALSLAPAPAEAHHEEGHNKGGGGGNPKSESNDKVFPVKVTFDDVGGDSIQSDDGTPYINNKDGVRAVIPVDGPPGQLLVDLGGKEPRTFFFDLGPDCDFGGEPGVIDAGNVCVECPFGAAVDSRCKGDARGTLFARDPIEITGGVVNDLGYILTMDIGPGTQMRAQYQEVEFRVVSQGWWKIGELA